MPQNRPTNSFGGPEVFQIEEALTQNHNTAQSVCGLRPRV